MRGRNRQPRIPRGEASILVILRLLFMLLNCLQECLSFACNFPVLDRYHLVEVDGVILLAFLESHLLIVKSATAASKGLHMVPGAQLEIESLELILDLSVVLARSRTQFLVFRDVVQDIALDRRDERTRHVLICRSN